MNYDKLNEWEQNNYEELANTFIEEHQDLWADFVLRQYEEEHETTQ